VAGIVATGERMGKIQLVDIKTRRLLHSIAPNRIAKRMRWVGDRLFFNHSASLCYFDLVSGAVKILTKDLGNTIEDFAFSPCGRYIAAVCYTRELVLIANESWTVLSRILDDKDYSKGLFWLPGETLELVTFGRSGNLNFYEVYEEILFKKKVVPNVSNQFV
jgi:hypothetical protein